MEPCNYRKAYGVLRADSVLWASRDGGDHIKAVDEYTFLERSRKVKKHRMEEKSV